MLCDIQIGFQQNEKKNRRRQNDVKRELSNCVYDVRR